jgi:hypothetical protein
MPGLPETQTRGLLIASTTAAAAVFTTTAATTATGPLFAGFGDVDRQFATVDRLAAESADGRLRFLGGAHGDEAETTRTTGFAVHHQVDLGDDAVRGKGIPQLGFSGVEGEVSHKQFIAHI